MTSDCHERGETRRRWAPRPDGLEESVQFTPGYRCPVTGWNGHGRHGMEIHWYLRGPAGAVVFGMFAGWEPSDLPLIYPGPQHGQPYAECITFHARRPVYEDQAFSRDDCDVIGGPCYCDVGYSMAGPVMAAFFRYGEQSIWDALEEHYGRLVTEENLALEAERNG